MTIKRERVNTQKRREGGFVLPYVLVTIAILSIASLIALERLSAANAMVASFQGRSSAEAAFANVENQLLYVVLSAEPVEGGLHVFPPQTSGADPNLSRRKALVPKDKFWSAKAQPRVFKTPYGPVSVTYRDSGAFVPLNTAPMQDIAKTLQILGVGPDASRQAAARLIDYRDSDNMRSFRGAERADYRLHKLSGPANSPLRDYAELRQILGWDKIVKTVGLDRIMRLTTLDPKGYLKQIYMDEFLISALGLANSVAGASRVGASIDERAQDKYPSDRGRFVLRYKAPNGEILEKAIEIERRINQLGQPFRKYLVYDTIVRTQSDVLEGAKAADNPAP